MRAIGICFLIIILWQQAGWGQHKPQKASVAPQTVVVKFKNQPTTSAEKQGRTSPLSLQDMLGVREAAAAFPQKLAKNTTKDKARRKSSHLDGIYKLRLKDNESIEEAIARLQQREDVLYAEPYYLPELLASVDDVEYSKQYHLALVKAAEAWDISQGSSNIVIGVLDTGVKLDHPDLVDKIAYNEADPIDGIDNDGNGYVDDYYGWDFANMDNDPTADSHPHGTRVAGVCAAATNNSLGVAGSGYNSRFLPIKIFMSGNNYFNNGYEAIVYAADRGCQIINLSWGAAGGRSQYVQDIINYAVLEKDALVVASAGNTPDELDFYPASYEHVLSVAATNADDQKTWWTTYSRFVDLAAPGEGIFTTDNNGGYTYSTGTSFSSPLVAGAAALLRAQFPELNALQIAERLRRTADPIFTNLPDSTFNRMGSGRLNMYRALAEAAGPAIRKTSFSISNGFGPYAFYGDTVSLEVQLQNFLDPVSGLEVVLGSSSPYVQLLDSTESIASLATLGSAPASFRFLLSQDIPADHVLSFQLSYQAEGYSDYEYLEVKSGGDYLDFRNGDMLLTVASNGNLGYYFDYLQTGLGLRYMDDPLAHNLGLMLTQSPTAVADNAIRYTQYSERNKDFEKDSRIKFYENSTAGFDARSRFHTLPGDSTQLNLAIEQKVLGWESQQEGGSVVLEYRVSNPGDTAYENLNLALFADFNLGHYLENKAVYDAENQLSYVHATTAEAPYSGIALLTGQAPIARAIDLNTRSGNTADLGDTFTRKQKYLFTSQGTDIPEAGVSGWGNDVAFVSGGTIASLQPGQSEVVALAFLTAPDLATLQAITREAQENYRHYRENPPLRDSLLACSGEAFEVMPEPGQEFMFYADAWASEFIAKGESFTFTNATDSTFYIAPVYGNYQGDLETIRIKAVVPEADFALPADTVYLSAQGTAVLQFTDQSPDARGWLWNLGNGWTSTNQNPQTTYTEAGSYTISLQVETAKGCYAETAKTLTVIARTAAPAFDEQLACAGIPFSLQTKDQSAYTLYAAPDKTNIIYQGNNFSTSLEQDTVFYATAGEGNTESDVVSVPVQVFAAQSSIHSWYSLEENVLTANFSVSSNHEDALESISWFIDGTLSSEQLNATVSFADEARAVTAELVLTYQSGCQEQLSATLSPTASPAPALQDVSLCAGSTLELIPDGQGPFRFFADAALSQWLGSGESLTLQPDSSSSVYAISYANGLASPASKASITALQGSAVFTASADTVYIKSDPNLKFTAVQPDDISQYYWEFGDGLSSEEPSPLHAYEQEGTYTVRLTVATQAGCTESYERQVVALNVYGVSDEPVQQLTAYPNPSSDLIRVQLPQDFSGPGLLQLHNMQGRLVLEQSLTPNPQLSLRALPAGMYMLVLRTGQKVYQTRIIKQ